MSRSNRQDNISTRHHAISRSPSPSPTAVSPLVRLPAASNMIPYASATARSADLNRLPEGPSRGDYDDERHLNALTLVHDRLGRAGSQTRPSDNFHLPSAPPGFGYGGLAGTIEDSSTSDEARRSRLATANPATSHTRHHHRSTSRNISPRGARAREPTPPPTLGATRTQNDVPTDPSNNLADSLWGIHPSGLAASFAGSQAGSPSRTRSLNTLPPNVIASEYFSESPAHHELLQTIIRHFYPGGAPPPTMVMIVYAAIPDASSQPSQDGAHADPSTASLANTTGATGPADDPFNARASITLLDQGGLMARVRRHRIAFVHPPTAPIPVRHGHIPAVSVETLASLPRRPLPAEDFADGPTGCGICLDDASEGQQVTVLPCGHWFDRECIEAWLERHNSCPVCRRTVQEGA